MLKFSSALGVVAAVLLAAPAADAQDRNALAGHCYGLKTLATVLAQDEPSAGKPPLTAARPRTRAKKSAHAPA